MTSYDSVFSYTKGSFEARDIWNLLCSFPTLAHIKVYGKEFLFVRHSQLSRFYRVNLFLSLWSDSPTSLRLSADSISRHEMSLSEWDKYGYPDHWCAVKLDSGRVLDQFMENPRTPSELMEELLKREAETFTMNVTVYE